MSAMLAMSILAVVTSKARAPLTYGTLLLLFLVAPMLALAFMLWWDSRRKKPSLSDAPTAPTAPGWRFSGVLLALVAVAILYTLPWDNHLIALRVWWYSPARISGVVFGYVPLEEVAFFVLQTLFVGVWFLWLVRHAQPRPQDVAARANYALRLLAASVGACLWALALAAVFSGWRAATYVGWEFIWALPPIIVQLGVGADILWRQRRLLCLAIAPMVLYLCAVDALAIRNGIWTINPQQSLGLLLGGQLPIEEFFFFLLTTTVVVFGLALGTSPLLRRRFSTLLQRARLATALRLPWLPGFPFWQRATALSARFRQRSLLRR